MDVIDRLNHRMKLLKQLGVQIRFEDLGGVNGGLCEVGGEKILMVDVALPSSEQLEIFEDTISQIQSQGRAVA